MKKDFAKKLIKKTQEDYNRIAKHFSSTRVYPWSEMKKFIDYIKDSDKVLDLGCGNGRLLEILKKKDIDYIGLDASKELLKIASKKYPEYKFLIGDVLDLPFDNNTFDIIFSIAVLHSIPGEESRLKAFSEIKRVLKKDGILTITVWNLWEEEKYLPYIKSEVNDYDIGDALIPWKDAKGNILAERYYHAFKKEGLENLVKKTGLKILDSGLTRQEKPNSIYVIAKN